MNNQELTLYRREQFSRAAHNYNSVATIQKSMARHVFEAVKKLNVTSGPVVELGAGTGLCSLYIQELFSNSDTLLCYTDFSRDMLKQHILLTENSKKLNHQNLFVQDAQKLSVKNVNLLISNAMVQWIPDLTAHLTQCQKALVSGGYYLCTGFGSKNLYPLYNLLDQLAIKTERRPFHTFSSIEDAAATAGLKLVEYHEWSESESFDSVFALLSQIKKLGAGGSANQVFLGRKGLKSLEEIWPREDGGSIRSIWHPWLVLLRK